MLSRRRFLLGSLAGFGLIGGSLPLALAKKSMRHAAMSNGPRVLSQAPWSPAVSADFIGVLDNQHCCIAAEGGRLTIVDLLEAEDEGSTTRVLSELNGIGKKIIDFCVMPKRALALVTQPDASDWQYAIAIVNLSSPFAPELVSRTPLNNYSECTSFACSQNLICVAGVSSSGENLVSIYNVSKGKNGELTWLGSMTVDGPIKTMDLLDRNLLVLHGADNPSLSIVSLTNPRVLDLKKTLALSNNYAFITRLKDVVLLTGNDQKNCVAQLVTVSGKAPKIRSSISLPEINQVLSTTGAKNTFLILGESASGGKLIISYAIDKDCNFSDKSIVPLLKEKEQASSAGRLAMDNRAAFIACGWSGIEMLSSNAGAWSATRRYSIPRLPASGIAAFGNFVVLAGADLKLYNIAQPSKPIFMTTAMVSSAIKAVAAAGSFVLCLSRDNLTLRKIERLKEVVATLSITADQMCFDAVKQQAYLLSQEKGKTIVAQLDVYSNSITSKKSFELKSGLTRAFAHEGQLLVGGLSDLAFYDVADELKSIGNLHLDNLAMRDFILGTDHIFATAIDANSQGFLLVLSKEQGELKTISSTKIPHDGVALAIANQTIATVGSTLEGKNLITLIDISRPSAPQVIKSLPALESASSVTMQNKLAILAGRGLEIISMS